MLNYKVYYDPYKTNWVVFVHGIGGNINTWKNQVNDLGKNNNLLLIDLPWHGNSCVEQRITISMLNKHIKDILDKEMIRKATFAGISLGSLVVSQFAIAYPEYVDRLIFIGSVIEVRPICKLIVVLGEMFRYILPYKLIYNLAIMVIVPKRKASIDGSFYRSEFINMGRKKLIEWIEYLSVILDGKNVVEKLKGLEKEICFISGEYDKMFIKGAKKTAETLGQELVVMDNCTHICNNDNPEMFNKLMSEFLLCTAI